jgi:hypothetical protein
VQVVQSVLKDTFSTTIGPGWIEIPNFSCIITPSSLTSKILINLSLNYGQHYFLFKARLLRNNVVIDDALGNLSGARARSFLHAIGYDAGSASGLTLYDMRTMSGNYSDSPSSVLPQTYSVQIGGYNASYAVYINRAHTFSNRQDYEGSPISTLTVMEVVG